MKIFEPAICCPTGLCDVGVDPELLRVSTVLNTLKEKGAAVQKYNLTSAPIAANWWVINQSFYHANTTNSLLQARASNEVEWINRIDRHNDGKFAVVAWSADQIKGEKLLQL